MANTPRGIRYPLPEDALKASVSASKLAADIQAVADTADAAISSAVVEAVTDADGKYGGLPSRMTAVEQKNTVQDGRLNTLDALVKILQDRTLVIDAPAGFDPNTVTVQSIHAVNTADEALNMPDAGAWILFTWPQTDTALTQLAVRYDIAGAQLMSRIKTTNGWSSWKRLDADKWLEKITELEWRTPYTNRVPVPGVQNTQIDEARNRLWTEANTTDGGPTEHALSLLVPTLPFADKGEFEDLSTRVAYHPRVPIPGVQSTETDQDGHRTWQESNDIDGGPTEHSLGLLIQHLPLSNAPQLTAASVQVSASKARAMRKHLASDPVPTGTADVTANGQAARITWPAPGTWDYLSPVPVLLHFGGVGDTSLDAYEAWAADVAAAGIVVARCLFHGDSYGSQNAMDDAVALVNHVLERAPVSGIIAYGHSMGGVAALNTLTTGDLPTVMGVIITDGAVSLRQRWDAGRQTEITAAYGITPANPYEVATKGFDPMLEPAGKFRGMPIGIVGSDADTSVPFSAHGRALAAKLSGSNPVTMVVHTGAHNLGRWNVKQLILDLTTESLGGPLSMPAATL